MKTERATRRGETRELGDRIAAAKREVRGRSHDGIERRTVQAKVELRAGSAGDEFRGHAAVFDDLSEDLGYFEPWYERIAPGAFASVLRKNPDVRALFNHDPNLPLARSTVSDGAGALVVEEDDEGLAYRFVPTATTYAADLAENVRAGVVSQSSFAFRVARKGDSWEEDDEGRLVRTIHQFSELYDVSPVTYPAYPTTDVSASAHDLEGSDEPAGTAPPVEREDDEAASQRVPDGDGEERQADEAQAEEDRAKARLDIRKRRMSGLKLMGEVPADRS